MTTCNRCGGVLSASATVCHHCGAPVRSAMPGSSAAGSLGPRQRAQEKWNSSLLSSAPNPFEFAPSPSSGPSSSNSTAQPPAPAGMSTVGQWKATSLIDPGQLPAWLNPPSPEDASRAGGGSEHAQPPTGRAPQGAQSGAGRSPFAPPPTPPASPHPPAAPSHSVPGASPYFSGGRRSTDDLFTASSLIDQTQLPDWLSPGRGRPGASASPMPENNAPPARPAPPAPPRPNTGLGQPTNDIDANLPDWLRALDPGAPPNVGRFSAERRAQLGANGPSAANRPASPSRRDVSAGLSSGADPFNISRVDAALPPRDAFSAGRSSAAQPSMGNPDQVPSYPPFSQPPRQNNAFPGTSRDQGFAASGQGFPPSGSLKAGRSRPLGGARPELRSAYAAPPDVDRLPAGSLIDEQALPEWLRTGNLGGSPPGRPLAANPHPAPSASGSLPTRGNAAQASGQSGRDIPPFLSSTPLSPFDGASLVDEQALPDWLRTSNQTEPLPLPFTVSDSVGSKNAGNERGQRKADAAPALGAGAADEEELPEWLRQVYSQAQVPPLSVEIEKPAARSPQTPGFSASELVDERVMPTWLREAAQTSPLANIEEILSTTPPAYPSEARQGATAPSPFFSSARPPAEAISGNALVDEASLPEWMRGLGDAHPPFPAAREASSFSPSTGPQQGSASGLFSAAELVDTQALPAWLKTQEAQIGLGTLAGAQGQSGPTGSASGLFSAAELVDTQALPAWLKKQEAKGTPAAPAPAPSGPASDIAGPTGSASGLFSATELVDTQALPAWLKAQEPGAGPAGPSAASSAAGSKPIGSKITPMPTGFSSQQTGAFSAAELVDTKSLPAWLKGAVAEPGTSTPATSQPGRGSPPRDSEGRMSAAELVDTQDLPAWLKGGAPTSGSRAASGLAATPNEPAPTEISGQSSGFSAASLVDPAALPDWLRPAQTGEGIGGSPTEKKTESGTGWERDPQAPSALSAASLIDENQLPDWMRNPEGAGRPGAQKQESKTLSGPHARVPRRPRLPTEPDRAPSESAASVFSSVLGPTAGEEQWNQPQSGRAGRSYEPPPAERGGVSGPLPERGRASGPLPERGGASGPLHGQRQSAEWEGGDAGGWGQPGSSARPPSQQPSRGPAQPPLARPPSQPRGRYEDEQWGGSEPDESGNAGAWPGDGVEWGAPAEQRSARAQPGYRPSGPMPGAQRGRATPPPDEPEERDGTPNRRQSGWTMAEPEYEQAGGREPEGYGGRSGFAAGPQRRGSPLDPAYQQEYAGWEGGPEDDQGLMGDDEVGPRSGVFAKIKRMLGLGR